MSAILSGPEVSVLMSAYNAEAHIDEAIQSILDQTFQNFEFVIVNDGSADSTLSKIMDFAGRDPRIKVLDQDNVGLTRSLVRAVEDSRGVYIARMDADDISARDRLECQVAYLQENQSVGMVGSCVTIIDSRGVVRRKKSLPRSEATVKRRLKYGNSFVHGSVMFRRRAYTEAGGYDKGFTYSQDYDLWLRISENWACSNLSKYLYFLREHDHSISMQYSEEQLSYAVAAVLKNVPPEEIMKAKWFNPFKGEGSGPYTSRRYETEEIEDIVSARLLLRRGDYQGARAFYSKVSSIESAFMGRLLQHSKLTLMAKKLYSSAMSILN